MKQKLMAWLWTWPEWFHRLLFDLTDHVIVECRPEPDLENGKGKYNHKWIDGRPLIDELNKTNAN